MRVPNLYINLTGEAQGRVPGPRNPRINGDYCTRWGLSRSTETLGFQERGVNTGPAGGIRRAEKPSGGSWWHPQAWRLTGGGDLSEGRCNEKGNDTSQRGWVAWATEVKKESGGPDREGKGGRERHRVGTDSIICFRVVRLPLSALPLRASIPHL